MADEQRSAVPESSNEELVRLRRLAIFDELLTTLVGALDVRKVLARVSEVAARVLRHIFRVYGAYNAVFGPTAGAIGVTAFRRGDRRAWWTLLVEHTIALGSAMKFDWSMNAIGPFERAEYLGLAMIYLALGITASFSVRPALSAEQETV